MSDPQKPQGKKQIGQGGKDQKLTKRNKNISTELPDRKKEAQLEEDVNREMKDVQKDDLLPWQKVVIELQLQGWDFESIIRKG